MEDNRKKINVNEIKRKLHKLDIKLQNYKGSNSLVNQYRHKVSYMLMWMRLIPIDKRTLKGWSMPDRTTITKFSKEIGGNSK